MAPVAAGHVALTSNCRRSLHKVRPCPLDLAQEKVSSFRSDFGGVLLLNRVFQTASLHVSGIPYKSLAVFGTLSTEVIHYSYSPPFIDKFVRHLVCAGPDDRIPKESLARCPAVLDSLKISSYELMQASTYMYCVRLQVETCNVQRGRLPRMTNDKWQMTNRNHLMGLTPGPRSFEVEWSNQHASTGKHLWAQLSLLRRRFRKLRRRTSRCVIA
jgi:hypothetical protein